MVCGTVNVSEMMGSAVHLHISACGTDTIIIVPTGDLENANAYAIGSHLCLHPFYHVRVNVQKTAAGHFFSHGILQTLE